MAPAPLPHIPVRVQTLWSWVRKQQTNTTGSLDVWNPKIAVCYGIFTIFLFQRQVMSGEWTEAQRIIFSPLQFWQFLYWMGREEVQQSFYLELHIFLCCPFCPFFNFFFYYFDKVVLQETCKLAESGFENWVSRIKSSWLKKISLIKYLQMPLGNCWYVDFFITAVISSWTTQLRCFCNFFYITIQVRSSRLKK